VSTVDTTAVVAVRRSAGAAAPTCGELSVTIAEPLPASD
jgi:hypothetical protein